MLVSEYPYAGLILPDACDLNPRPYLDCARRVLDQLDPIPDGCHPSALHPDTVRGAKYGVKVTAEEDSDYGPRILIEVILSSGARTDDEFAARILSDTVLDALGDSAADVIEWYSPGVLIDTDDFIRLRSYVSPRRVPTGKQSDMSPPAPLSQTNHGVQLKGAGADDLLEEMNTDILAELYPVSLAEADLAAMAPRNSPPHSDQMRRKITARQIGTNLLSYVRIRLNAARAVLGN